MPVLECSAGAAALRHDLLQFINDTLRRLDRRGTRWTPVSAETPLFATGLLDSMSILHLIAVLEELTDNRIPDELVVMKHFQTVDAMVAAFSSKNSTYC
jgi:acyl carrier protein